MSMDNPLAKIAPHREALSFKPAAAAEDAVTDLSREVEHTVERRVGDRVRCARVFEDYYRCNWWAPAAARKGSAQVPQEWSAASLHLVRKSRFLRVTRGPEGLSITGVAGEVPA